MTFKEKCSRANIRYNAAMAYKRRHPELTDEQVINYYKSKIYSYKSSVEKCRQAGISHSSYEQYRRRYPKLTDEQVINRIISRKNKISLKQKIGRLNK